ELPPAFDQHLRFGAAAEPFPVQKLVLKLAVEALDEPVLPGATRRDEGRADRRVAQPAHHLGRGELGAVVGAEDRKSTRLNSSHVKISYAVFCLKKKKNRFTSGVSDGNGACAQRLT